MRADDTRCCCRIKLRVHEQTQRLKLNMEQVRIVYEDMPEYEGEYSVVPQPYDATVLPTRNKAMRDDMIVTAIPYYEATNPQGGYTVTIG